MDLCKKNPPSKMYFTTSLNTVRSMWHAHEFLRNIFTALRHSSFWIILTGRPFIFKSVAIDRPSVRHSFPGKRLKKKKKIAVTK